MPVVDIDDDFNLYAYVKNDPLNATHPTGMQEFIGDIQLTAVYRGPEAATQQAQSMASGMLIGGAAAASIAGVAVAVEVAGPAIAAGLEVPAAVATGEAGIAAAAGSAATAELGGAAVTATANAATTTGQIVAGAASQVTQRGVMAAAIELRGESTAARAAAQGVQGAERVIEMTKAGAMQQEIRAAVAESRVAVEKAVEMLNKLLQ